MLPKARQHQVVVQEVGDELIVYDQLANRAHRLNHAAAVVWSHCDGGRSIPELADVAAEHLNLPRSEEIVRLALDRLSRANLLEAPVAEGRRRVTRRDVLRRLGEFGVATAVASLAVPVVSSIVAPTPLIAQYGGPKCEGPITTGGVGVVDTGDPNVCSIPIALERAQVLALALAEGIARRNAESRCPDGCVLVLIGCVRTNTFCNRTNGDVAVTVECSWTCNPA